MDIVVTDKLIARFWPKVEFTTGCWLWTAAGNGKKWGDYGRFGIGNTPVPAHRVAWTILRGPIPEGMDLDHLCKNHRCVRPDHLEPVTHVENLARGEGPPAKNALKTHCVHGHPLSGDNLYLDAKTGYRSCMECRRVNARNSYYRRIGATDRLIPRST